MPKITKMYCFAMYDKGPDDEGIPAFASPLGVMPMMGADVDRIASLMPRAQIIANETGQPLRIYMFDHMEQIGEVSPQAGMPATEPGRCPECRAMLAPLVNHTKDCSIGRMIDEVVARSLGLRSNG